MLNVMGKVLYTIRNQPAAFDADKVVEHLQQRAEESRKYWEEFNDKDAFGEMNAYSNAVAILKSALNQ